MAWFFGDSFDLYSMPSDAVAAGTYWDGTSSVPSTVFQSGRFAGSQSISFTGGDKLIKTSGSNDQVHHFVVAVYYVNNISAATNVLFYIELFDGTTAQCSIGFLQNGTIVITSGAPGGTILATSPVLVTAGTTWFGFEFEVVLSATTGSFTIRKNGNNVNDFQATGLNNINSGNAYANKIQISESTSNSWADDFLWRSASTAPPWVGDIRSYTRRPVSDQSVQWTPVASTVAHGTPPALGTNTSNIIANIAVYTPIVARCNGTVTTGSVTLGAGYTGNMKMALWADNGSGAPGALLATATAIVNPVLGINTFTFPSPPSVTVGSQYWLGFSVDTSVTSGWLVTNFTNPGSALWTSYRSQGSAFATFPVANPAGSLSGPGANVMICSMNVTPTGIANAPQVNEPQDDGTVSYVYSSTVGQADLYGISSIIGVPASVVGVVTRAYALKSDGGTRNIEVNLKSGSTNSAGTSTALNTVFNWIWRVDQVDPATSAAWTAVGVNNLQIGEQVTA